jgi:hypothetical protein
MLDCTNVKNKHEDKLIQKQGVVGVGVGHKWTDGVPLDQQPAIIVFVNRKRSKRGVAQKYSLDDVVPSEIDGYPTDVIEVGKIIKHGFTQRIRPIKPGYSCGQADITAGTIGGFFLDRDGDLVILSNNHVLANENRAKIGDPIYQPGPYDASGDLSFKGWTEAAANLPYFALLKKFVTLVKDGNITDSAIAVVHPAIIKAGLIDPLYPILNRGCTGIASVGVGTQVQKCGRTTGYTTGRVLALSGTFTVGYDFGPATFKDCVVTTVMSKPGDSGSVILDMGMKGVAHLFAGSSKVTISNPLTHALNEYGLSPMPSSGGGGGLFDTLDFGDNTWRQFSAGGKIEKTDKLLTITAAGNQFAYIESELGNFNSVSVVTNTGSDRGATWGPGLAIQWPTGIMKVNVRHGDRFGGYFNGTYNITVGSVKENTDYTLRIRKSTVGTYVAEVQDGGRWYTVLELPTSIFPQSPVAVRVGKTDLTGQPSNHTEAGPVGTSIFHDFIQN